MRPRVEHTINFDAPRLRKGRGQLENPFHRVGVLLERKSQRLDQIVRGFVSRSCTDLVLHAPTQAVDCQQPACLQRTQRLARHGQRQLQVLGHGGNGEIGLTDQQSQDAQARAVGQHTTGAPECGRTRKGEIHAADFAKFAELRQVTLPASRLGSRKTNSSPVSVLSGVVALGVLQWAMFITGLGTAAPLNRYSQAECWEACLAAPQFSRLSPRSRAILKKVFLGNNGIATRHLVLNSLSEAFDLTPDALHARFVEQAPTLAAQAAQRALEDAQSQPDEIDAIIISTCTGYLCPGLTSYVSERLGLRPDALALDLVGQGCGAALPNLRTAEALLAAGRAQRVLSACVEVCSAAFYLDDDPGVLISACLFGDGAGAAVLSPALVPGRRRIEWKTAGTVLSPADRDYLRFEQRGGMLRNILTRQVPTMAAKHAETVLCEVLDRSSVSREQIKMWILHAGGRDVLTAMQDRLGLGEADLCWSAAVLREFGNLSSASVYFILQAALADPTLGGFWWMSSFGAGFSCHGALLEVQ